MLASSLYLLVPLSQEDFAFASTSHFVLPDFVVFGPGKNSQKQGLCSLNIETNLVRIGSKHVDQTRIQSLDSAQPSHEISTQSEGQNNQNLTTGAANAPVPSTEAPSIQIESSHPSEDISHKTEDAVQPVDSHAKIQVGLLEKSHYVTVPSQFIPLKTFLSTCMTQSSKEKLPQFNTWNFWLTLDHLLFRGNEPLAGLSYTMNICSTNSFTKIPTSDQSC